MSKIYDAFTFFNELDLLELRLEELDKVVDYFVLVESDATFTNISKPYYFDENKDRFAKFLHKIKHVKMISQRHSNAWQNEYDQRNGIIQGCTDAEDNDVIIISDIDEIPRTSAVRSVRQSRKDISALYTPFFYFKLNFISIHPDCYIPVIIAVKKRILAEYGAQTVRSMRDWFIYPHYYMNRDRYTWEVYHHAGWHFGYLGDNAFIKQKMVSFSHADDHSPEYVEQYNVDDELHEGTVRFTVKIDEYFPKTVLRNLDKYQQYINEGGTISAKDCFPNI